METVDELVGRIAGVLAGRDEIREAYLFGSCARDVRHAHSDVDIAVFVDPESLDTPGFGYTAALTSVLMSGLGTDRIDVVVLNQAPPLMYHRVLRDGIRVLSRDLRATTIREGKAISRYCDYVPQLAKIDAAMGVGRRPEPKAP